MSNNIPEKEIDIYNYIDLGLGGGESHSANTFVTAVPYDCCITATYAKPRVRQQRARVSKVADESGERRDAKLLSGRR